MSKSLYNIDAELLCEPTQKHYLLNCCLWSLDLKSS